MLDNIADLLLTVSLLVGVFGFPTNVALRYMVPGTAIGVLAGDLMFFWLAFRLARQTGRNGVTAMPLGLDTPSTFGMVFFVLGPAFLAAKSAGISSGLLEDAAVQAAAIHTWHIGICSIFISGLFKFACALGSGWIRRLLPRAGLLGSLTAVALVLISFLPLLEILQMPLVGLAALAVVLTTLVARIDLPLKIPGALGALVVAGVIFYGMHGVQGSFPDAIPVYLQLPQLHADFNPQDALFPYEWLAVFRFGWVSALPESLQYLPVVIPFALGTVVGGIDCTESAAAAGDEYDTATVIGIEAGATLIASLCGGVIQSTPYIGHPAYKAMGGRAAYTLATAVFVGAAGLIGFFGYFYAYVPKAAVFPILIFVGLEITAQSFLATARRHYSAVALACVPALAQLAIIFLDKFLAPSAQGELPAHLANELLILRILANGFIVTSLIWASALAAIIDRRLIRAAFFFALAAICTSFGVMHSPAAGSPIFWPWSSAGGVSPTFQSIAPLVAGYTVCAVLFAIWGIGLRMAGIKPLHDDGGHGELAEPPSP
jgi:AGZA family xanthine/uracil permease-like MFS transporter